MIYYRVALYKQTNWSWKSTIITSLEAVQGLMKMYGCMPKDRIRIFYATVVGKLDEMLARENEGLTSNSMTAAQFLDGQRISREDIVRLEVEVRADAKKVAIPASVAVIKALNENRVDMHSAGINIPDLKRLELEAGTPCDHDTPYRFSLPTSMPQTLAWLNLMVKVQLGELEP